MSTRIILNNWRFTSFGKPLFEPVRFDPNDTKSAPRFSFTMLADPNNPAHAKQLLEIEEIERREFRAKCAAKSDEDFEKKWAALAWDDRVIRDGDKKAEYDGFEGMKYISANATPPKNAAPFILSRNKERLSEGDPGAPYGGCYVNAQIDIWAQWGTYKGTRATILGVQFVKDGDAFGGGRPGDAEAMPDLGDQGEDEDELAGLA